MDYDEKAKTWDEDPARGLRASVVADRIRERIPLSREMSALEYGAGTGLLSFALQPYLGQITMADISRGMLDATERKIAASGLDHLKAARLDLVNDPLPAERYDIIYLLLSLHHVEDTDRILRAFHDLLVPKGFLCVADMDPEDGSFHREAFAGHLGFDRQDLADRARRAGFEGVRVEDVLEITKERHGVERQYPMFLMIAQVGEAD